MSEQGHQTEEVPPPPTREDLRWQDAAADLQFTQLATVRATAEKWRTGLAGLTGLISVAIAVAGPEQAKKLPACDRTADGLLLLAAVLALASGAWRAMRAAFGKPVRITDDGPALRAWTGSQTTAAVRDIRWARDATVGGFVLLAAAAAVAFTTAYPDGPTFQVTSHMGEFCGTLGSPADGSGLTVTSADGTRRTLALPQVTSVVSRDSC